MIKPMTPAFSANTVAVPGIPRVELAAVDILRYGNDRGIGLGASDRAAPRQHPRIRQAGLHRRLAGWAVIVAS